MEPANTTLPEQSPPPAAKAAKGERILGIIPANMVDGFAAVSSLTLGGLVAWREILAESYRNFTDMKLTDHIKTKHRKDFGPAIAQKIESGMPEKQAVTEILANNKAYHAEVAKFFKISGFSGISGFPNRIKLLNSHEAWKIALTGGAVTAVALGSILVFSRDLFKGKEKESDTAPAPQSTSFVQAEQERAAKGTPSPSIAI